MGEQDKKRDKKPEAKPPEPIDEKNPAVTHIIERKTYIDNNGRIVCENRVVFGQPPKDYVRFAGQGKLTVELAGGAMGSKRFPIPLPNARTIDEAFEQIHVEFPAAQAQAIVDIRKEVAEQAHRAGAGIQMPLPGILGPDGAPAGISPFRGGPRGRGGRRH